MSMDFFRPKVKARVYTESNISEGIPSGKWQYRLLQRGDTVELVEAYGCENGGNGWGSSSDDILDQSIFNETVETDPGTYSSSADKYEKYVAWVFTRVFHLENKEGEVVFHRYE